MQYTVSLPVYKQGDDLDRCLELSDHDAITALRLLGANYRDAAERCEDLAAYIDHHKIEVDIVGSNHWISVLSTESLDTLAKSHVTEVSPLLTIVETDPDEDDLDEYLEQMDIPDQAFHQRELTW